MEQRTVVCPNCGATTTNLHHCEFCGSLLVSFVEKDVNIDDSWYGNDALVIDGLLDALRENIDLQEDYPGQMVCTDIFDKSDVINLQFTNVDQNYAISETPRLIIFLRLDSSEFESFKELPISKLFTCSWNNGIKMWECCIDFGKDCEVASRMVTQICYEFYHVTELSGFKIDTWKDGMKKDNNGCLGALIPLISLFGAIGCGVYSFCTFVANLV